VAAQGVPSGLIWGWRFDPPELGEISATDHVYGRAMIFNSAASTEVLSLEHAGVALYSTYRNGVSVCCEYLGGFGRDEPYPWSNFQSQVRAIRLSPGQFQNFDFITLIPENTVGATPGSYSIQAAIAPNPSSVEFDVREWVFSELRWTVAMPPTFMVVEYYAASLDHYFITSITSEIQALDQGAFGGAWTRTGQSFNAWSTATAAPIGAVPVCRVFISYSGGSSHFYSGFANECAAASTTPGAPLFLETPNMMYIQLASPSGMCPIGTQGVYRLWNNRADSNHRFTTDIATRDQMIAAGWRLEGSAPGFATMCAPQ
jgi:hypothetical protein